LKWTVGGYWDRHLKHFTRAIDNEASYRGVSSYTTRITFICFSKSVLNIRIGFYTCDLCFYWARIFSYCSNFLTFYSHVHIYLDRAIKAYIVMVMIGMYPLLAVVRLPLQLQVREVIS
jgi:hypothetical protein